MYKYVKYIPNLDNLLLKNYFSVLGYCVFVEIGIFLNSFIPLRINFIPPVQVISESSVNLQNNQP